MLDSGEEIEANDIAWGRDDGDAFDHVSANVSPPGGTELPFFFFHTSEVVRLRDATTGTALWEAPDSN